MSLEDVLTGATPEAKKALRFFEENYRDIGHWLLGEPAKKVVLTSSRHNVCRFCDRASPIVTFRKKAHAIPECLGNKVLTTQYECDACNEFFGKTIENDFGNWSKTLRALCDVKGKNGAPVLRNNSSKPWRIERTAGQTSVTQDDTDPVVVVDETENECVFTVPTDRYTPVAVLKAFTKMGLSLLPDEELPNFQRAKEWILNPDHQVGLVKTAAFPVFYTFVPGTIPFGRAISIILLKRRPHILTVPYMIFVLSYGNEVFQVILPSPECDIGRYSGEFPYFPNPYELDPNIKSVSPLQRRPIDLTGRSPVNKGINRVVMR